MNRILNAVIATFCLTLPAIADSASSTLSLSAREQYCREATRDDQGRFIGPVRLAQLVGPAVVYLCGHHRQALAPGESAIDAVHRFMLSEPVNGHSPLLDDNETLKREKAELALQTDCNGNNARKLALCDTVKKWRKVVSGMRYDIDGKYKRIANLTADNAEKSAAAANKNFFVWMATISVLLNTLAFIGFLLWGHEISLYKQRRREYDELIDRANKEWGANALAKQAEDRKKRDDASRTKPSYAEAAAKATNAAAQKVKDSARRLSGRKSSAQEGSALPATPSTDSLVQETATEPIPPVVASEPPTDPKQLH